MYGTKIYDSRKMMNKIGNYLTYGINFLNI